MYVAQDRETREMVAIKRYPRMSNNDHVELELYLLKSCVSRFIVRYYDVLIDERDLCVCSFGWIQSR